MSKRQPATDDVSIAKTSSAGLQFAALALDEIVADASGGSPMRKRWALDILSRARIAREQAIFREYVRKKVGG